MVSTKFQSFVRRSRLRPFCFSRHPRRMSGRGRLTCGHGLRNRELVREEGANYAPSVRPSVSRPSRRPSYKVTVFVKAPAGVFGIFIGQSSCFHKSNSWHLQRQQYLRRTSAFALAKFSSKLVPSLAWSVARRENARPPLLPPLFQYFGPFYPLTSPRAFSVFTAMPALPRPPPSLHSRSLRKSGKGASRYDVCIGGGRGSWRSRCSKGCCVNF